MAGSADDRLSKQIQHRAQVQSQLRIIKLPNYTEEQLRVIFRRMVQFWFAKRMKLEGSVDDRYVRTLIRGPPGRETQAGAGQERGMERIARAAGPR